MNHNLTSAGWTQSSRAIKTSVLTCADPQIHSGVSTSVSVVCFDAHDLVQVKQSGDHQQTTSKKKGRFFSHIFSESTKTGHEKFRWISSSSEKCWSFQFGKC